MSDIRKIKVGNEEHNIEGSFRVNEMPTASSSLVNKIYQYLGETNSNYTNGYFYKCVLNSGSYIWTNISVQAGGGTDAEAVHFTSQTLTSSQQQQARTNISTFTLAPYDPSTTPVEGVLYYTVVS